MDIHERVNQHQPQVPLTVLTFSILMDFSFWFFIQKTRDSPL